MSHGLSKRHHALAIPLPAQGHSTPLMRFCKRLAAQEGFKITFVDIIVPFFKSEELNKQENTSIDANNAPAAAAQAQETLDITRVHIFMGPMEIRQGSSFLESLFEALQSLAPQIEELLSKLIHEDPSITCLISDLYMTPAQKVADKFNIPRIALQPPSQSVLLLVNYILEEKVSLEEVLKVVARKEGLKEETFVEGLPGLPTLRNGDLMDFHDDNLFMYSLSLQVLKEAKERSHAIVVNTIEELEGPALKVNIGAVPIYAVGPLIEPLDKDTNTSLWKEDKECMMWLNEQGFHSVLYISFGSLVSLSKAQIDEIGAGLISSQQRFLWVFRPDLVKETSYANFIVDLISKSHGKGFSIEWAPQISVLSHPSVGGFLTHCGWNSTIEAISLGVPMLCFPHFSDQLTTAKFVTQEWKIGLGFKMCKESGLIERDKVDRVIKKLMVEEEGKVLRRNANYFKEVSQQNLLLEGTSSKNIQALVHSLK